VSIGGCETGTETNGAATGDDVFQEADAEGMTFSISTGDSGADECGNGGTTPSWPADSEYVVAVGGTDLYTSGSTTWANETAWSDGGGSPSTFEPMPSWQQGVGKNAGHSTRGLPDVAFDGDPNSGAIIIVHGSTEQVGGTSLSSPLFVGVWARTLATNSCL
jgi:subtilase family serine protease